MPEEVNRVLTDRLSDLLLIPSRDAQPNLIAEGIEEERIRFVGNVMIDTLMHQLPYARALDMPAKLGLEHGRYAVATLHRPSNVDDPHALTTILGALALVSNEMPVVIPLHPRTRKNAQAFGLEALLAPLVVLEPIGYREMLSLTDKAAIALTDSGGLQEETTVLGVPCVTLREQTERPITISEGTNCLAGWPLVREQVVKLFFAAVNAGRLGPANRPPEGWDGNAAGRVVSALARATCAEPSGEMTACAG